jgi:signal transduction histidine kinase/ActR/RegA family two-component response regulator
MRTVRWLHRAVYAWILALLLLAGVWGAYFVQIGAIRDRAVTEAGAKADEIATAYARFVSGNLGLIDDIMRFIAAYYRENGLERTAALATDQRLYEAFHGNIVVLDAAGHGVLVNKAGSGPMVLSDRPYFQQAIDPRTNDRLVVGTPVPARSNGVIVLPFARSIRDADGKLLGAVAASLDVKLLEQLYDQLALGPGGVVVMTGTQDHVIRARIPEGDNFVGQTSNGSQLWSEIGKAPTGSYWQKSILDSRQRLYAYRTLADFPIVVTAGVALDDIVAESAQLRRNLLYAAAGATAVILLLLFGWLQELASRRALSAETRRADEASRAKSDFLASMSHELRTPLNGLLGFARLLRAAPLDEPYRRYVELLNDSGKHLYALINDILDFSKIEAGKMAFEDASIELGSLVEGAIAIMAPGAAEKRLTLDCRMADGLPVFVRGDPNRVRQILLNLITNSVKFTQSGGIEVRVTAGREGRIRFEVQDTGVGIAPEDQAKLFQRFQQLDAGISRSHGGTGLGLAISASLVRLMAGEIGVTSTPGNGATFWFELPLPEATPLPFAHILPADRAASPHTRPLRILVAEDVPMNQLLVQSLLETIGHSCDIADNGQQAVEAAAAAGYDVILMDLHMPVMNGLDATRAIRNFTAPANMVPIVALTANAFAEDIAVCKAAGMNDFVPKPLDFDLLARVLDRWALPVPVEID